MKRTLFIVAAALMLLSASTVQAQTNPVVGTERIQFDQAATTVTEANGLTYRLVLDGVRNPTPISVTCVGSASPFACTTAAFPALTPGDHQIALTASLVVNGVEAESLPSTPLPVRMIVAPQPPQNLRIVRD